MKEQTTQTAVEVVGAAIGSKATYTGSGFAAASWLFSSEAGVLIGIAVGVTGLCVNIYYRRKRDRREQELHHARLDAIRGPYYFE